MKKVISTENAPKAIGPYSQAVSLPRLIFVSGQIGLTPSGEMKEGVEAQTEQAIDNIENILKAIFIDLTGVLKTTIFLKNMADFAKVNEIYAKRFKEPYPARSTVAVVELPKGALVEIEVVATN